MIEMITSNKFEHQLDIFKNNSYGKSCARIELAHAASTVLKLRKSTINGQNKDNRH
jgi:hypothetical protein